MTQLRTTDAAPILLNPTERLHLQTDVSLAAMTSWHIGGQADTFIQPESPQLLADFLASQEQSVAHTWIGLGSNLLIRDGGVRGLVICSKQLKDLTMLDQETVYVQSGVTCAKFARFCCKHDLPNGAFFAGIPGTMGGALAMNAGAFGGETWPWVEQVEVISKTGTIYHRKPSDYDISYRSVSLKNQPDLQDEAFIGAIFRFPQISNQDGLMQIKQLLKKRSNSQPIGTLNCGSVYRNPPNQFAAKLIEGCGLKGFRINDAIISDKHANFIINLGHAKAEDIEAIMMHIEETVRSRYGILLEREVRIVGEPLGKQGSV